jgi:hypothetical protein
MKKIGIVSGSIRSGTSAAMNHIQNMGFNIYYDDTKPSDINNPNGYFEHRNVNLLRKNNSSWLGEVEKKVVKILPCELICKLPIENKYYIVFMNRCKKECANSFWKMVNSGVRPIPNRLKHVKKEDFLDFWSHKMEYSANLVINYMKAYPDTFSVLYIEQKNLNNSLNDIQNFLINI